MGHLVHPPPLDHIQNFRPEKAEAICRAAFEGSDLAAQPLSICPRQTRRGSTALRA
jgi:hypothetical protein